MEKWPGVWRVIGLALLFSGVALVAHILTRIGLPVALAFTATLMVIGFAIAWRRTPALARPILLRVFFIGLAVGVAATILYDAAKFLLSLLDPTPYNPFEALNIFGRLLLGPSAGASAILAAGIAFHLTNGIAFGVAYVFLFGGRGPILGIIWGILLEAFQLSLFPGWLDIRFLNEFMVISGLSHIIYGAVLGWGCQFGLRRFARPAAPAPHG